MTTSDNKARGRSVWPLATRLAIGCALLYFVFSRHADLEKVFQIIKSANLAQLGFVIFVAICGEAITAYKWRLLVRYIGGNLPLVKAVHAAFVGMFYNNFFPGSVGGDIARVLLIAKEAGGKAKATASAFMQRNTGLAGLFIIGIPAAFIWPQQIQWPGLRSDFPGYSCLTDCRTWLCLAAVGYTSVNAGLFSRYIYSRIWKLAEFEKSHLAAENTRSAMDKAHGLLRTALSKIQRFHTEMHGYRFWLLVPLAISAFTQIVDVFLVWNLAGAIHLSIPFHVVMVVVPMVSLANLLPITVNGIGLREAMYVALLVSVGVSANEAVALSLLQFAVITLMAGIGGAVHGITVARKPAAH